jgi:hypothetical protein
VPLISCMHLLSMWLASCFPLVPMCWDLLLSLAWARPVVAAPRPDVYSPSSPSGPLFYLALCLSVLSCLGPFLVYWALGFSEAAFLPALPLLLLFFFILPG